jgi:hypothetical protein
VYQPNTINITNQFSLHVSSVIKTGQAIKPALLNILRNHPVKTPGRFKSFLLASFGGQFDGRTHETVFLADPVLQEAQV